MSFSISRPPPKPEYIPPLPHVPVPKATRSTSSLFGSNDAEPDPNGPKRKERLEAERDARHEQFWQQFKKGK